MRVKFADKIEGATTHVTHCKCGVCTTEKFNAVHAATGSKPAERKLPAAVSGWLVGYGLHLDNLYAARQRLSRSDVDAHFAAKGTKLVDRMVVKSTLATYGLLD